MLTASLRPAWASWRSCLKGREQVGVVAHSFNLSTWEADLCELKTSLLYRVSSSPTRATQRDPEMHNKLTQLCLVQVSLSQELSPTHAQACWYLVGLKGFQPWTSL